MGHWVRGGRPDGRPSGLAIAGCVVFAVQASGQPAWLPEVPSPFGPYVRIEGRKNPELIPEHLAWASAFRSLAALTDRGAYRTIERELGLTADDLPSSPRRREARPSATRVARRARRRGPKSCRRRAPRSRRCCSP